MATKLSVWNDALRILGEHPLSSLSENVEPRYVIEAEYDAAVVFVLRSASWRFALVTAVLTHDAGLPSVPGYTYTFGKPEGWQLTHALFLQADGARECPFDAKEYLSTIHANAASSILIRFVSGAPTFRDEAIWPVHFAKAVSSYLASVIAERLTGSADSSAMAVETFRQFMADAVSRDAIPPDRWLPFQLDGTLRSATAAVLEHESWRFATKTVTLTPSGTASAGFGYRFAKPADWAKTVDAYDLVGGGRVNLPYRDEGGALHADRSTITLRYISTDGAESQAWPEAFSDAVYARCLYQSATTPEGVANALKLYKDRIKDADNRNELNEVHRVVGPGRFAAARRGGVGRFGYGREQGWPI
ncbi:hypothetical protein [Enterovirga sp. CN4-39]|uniref:hypothetical protein n=1 Tax=Enterovirga sp. CN4-39 TaxID=3400910 RepID=UPI003BFB52ED